MNFKLVLVFVFVAIALIDAKGPPSKGGKGGKPGPGGKKREKLPGGKRTTCGAGDVCAENRGRSGGFDVKKKGKADGDKLTILFDAIRERDANGTIVGKKGKLKHSLENFAQLDFLFTPMENIEMYKDNNSAGVNASYFSFMADIPGAGGANLSVNMFFFRGNGTGSFCENETFSVYPGAIKFDITIEKWDFCNKAGANCAGDEDGEFVDFVMGFQKKFKGKAKISKKKKGLKKGLKAFKKIFLGDQSLGFSNMYEIDEDKCGDMPDGYPKIEARGGKFLVTFRFPKFAKKVFYDPSVGDSRDEAEYTDFTEMDQPTEQPTTPGSSAGFQVASLFATLILGAFAMLF